jgi:hypothetical protein
MRWRREESGRQFKPKLAEILVKLAGLNGLVKLLRVMKLLTSSNNMRLVSGFDYPNTREFRLFFPLLVKLDH